jgi:DNA-directed RNA polymerase subunit E'/Rpb7
MLMVYMMVAVVENNFGGDDGVRVMAVEVVAVGRIVVVPVVQKLEVVRMMKYEGTEGSHRRQGEARYVDKRKLKREAKAQANRVDCMLVSARARESQMKCRRRQHMLGTARWLKAR